MLIIATGIISTGGVSGTVGMIVDVDHDHDRHDQRRRQLRRRAPRRKTYAGLVELPAFVPPYFSARTAKFRMFVKHLFHKSGSAALLAKSSLDQRAIPWAKMNFRNERRTPLSDALPKCAKWHLDRVEHPQRSRSDQISYRANLHSRPPAPVRHSAICSEPAGEAAGASPRRTFKLGRLICPTPPCGRKLTHGHHGAGKPLAALDFQTRVGRQHFGCGWKND